jgi:HSP20 family protein
MNTPTVTPTPGNQPAASAAAGPDGRLREEPALLPAVDVVEDATGLTLYADMPGVPKDRLNLHVEGETLLIEGEVVLPLPQGMAAHHAEVQRTRYRRAFTLSRELDPEQVSAELSHGVLRLRIPKAAHAQPRRIAVQVA